MDFSFAHTNLIYLGRSVATQLIARRVDVKGDLYLNDGFRSKCGVDLSESDISGYVDFTNGHIGQPALKCQKLPAGTAVALNDAMIGRSALFNQLEADGFVDLTRGNVKGDIDFTGTLLSANSQACPNGLIASGLEVVGRLFWVKLVPSPCTVLGLYNANVGQLIDSKTSWPLSQNTNIEGFSYARLSAENEVPQPTLGERLEWLRSQSFVPDIYENLAKAYRDNGREESATQVLIAEEDVETKHFGCSALLRFGLIPLRCTAALGRDIVLTNPLAKDPSKVILRIEEVLGAASDLLSGRCVGF